MPVMTGKKKEKTRMFWTKILFRMLAKSKYFLEYGKLVNQSNFNITVRAQFT